MIFYFTGTGNSKFIADKLGACLGEKTIDIGKALKNSEFIYDCSEEDNIGFVFPTYGWSIPTTVSEFVTNMELDNIPESAYVFAVNNCGSSSGRALYDLNKLLADKNITLDYCRSIVFPDNYIPMFNVPEDEEVKKILRSANIKLANVINNIMRNKKSLDIKKGIMLLSYKIINTLFVKFMNGTSKFTVSDKCVGCGLCSEICNSQAIEIQDGKPVWIKKNCVHCLACISRCPVEAIEYGSKTKDKVRYINPLVKFNESVNIAAVNMDIEEENTEEVTADNTDDFEEVDYNADTPAEENFEDNFNENFTENINED